MFRCLHQITKVIHMTTALHLTLLLMLIKITRSLPELDLDQVDDNMLHV